MFQPGIFARINVLVVGDVMLDRYWFGKVDRISPEAPVPVVAIDHCEERAGGAANVANNVAALGGQCVLLSVVGDDEAGRALSGLMERSGVRPLLVTDPEAATTVKLRVVCRNQQLIRVDFEKKPNHEILSRCLDHYGDELRRANGVIVSDYGKGGLVHIREIISAARAANKPVIVDPKGSDFSRYAGATTITPNMKELEQVVGDISDESILASKCVGLVESLDLEYLLLTRSDKGMTLFDRDGGVTHSPARAREVYDVSGAGDTVISAFALSSIAGMSDDERLAVANTAAGVVVGKLGTATASEKEVIDALGGDTS